MIRSMIGEHGIDGAEHAAGDGDAGGAFAVFRGDPCSELLVMGRLFNRMRGAFDQDPP